jgi:ketosteroid isomerase-like protein
MSSVVAALLLAASAAPAPDPAVAEIARLEQQWGEAFVKRDFDFIERIVAPEYRLVAASPDGRSGITRRSEWMANSRAFSHQAFVVETVDVNHAGDTAVASVQGLWTVARRADQPARPVRFYATDTWLRRNGQWQVIHRYSHRLPDAAWPPAEAQTSSSR